MTELEVDDLGANLQGLDAAASDARSVLRRVQRLEAKLTDQDDGQFARAGQAARESVERLVEMLEEARAERRRRLRDRLRGGGESPEP
ncbi:MAG: hypothetical protein ACYCYK_01065 [Candidatus Dormibacteria bacterium]